MPVCSYVVHASEEDCLALCEKLNSLPGCEASPSDDKKLIILVTETDSPEDDEKLQNTFKAIPEIQGLALTFGQLQTEFN